MALSCALDQVCIAAWGCFCGDGNYVHMMAKNLKDLQNTMKELEDKRGDVLKRVVIEEDKGLQRLDQVEGWLSSVNDARSQVNGLLEDQSTETGRLRLLGFYSEDWVSSYDYGERVVQKLNEVKELISKGDFVVVAQKSSAPKAEKKHILTTVGLNSMVEKAWSNLVSGDRRTLGIYGMGGVGKTTLLTRINNKFLDVGNEFDVVIWVVVSKDLQNEGIQDQILKRLCVDKEWKQETGEEKASRIHNILNRKKFVLLLDDIWSEVDLNMIGVPFPTQENGSKIVFTTRLKEVCRGMRADEEMKVDCLSPDEAWELFQITVGDFTFKRDQDILPLARKIVKKCCGLPLALCVIGKTMACKETIQEWRHAVELLDSSIPGFPGIKQKILPLLKFSYDSLEDENVKSCFLYYSLFPEDYAMEKDELIEYWKCEKLIDGKRDEYGVNNKGHDIIGSLVRAHLLMESGPSRNFVKMHDVIREMALWIGSEFRKHKEALFVRSGEQLHHIPKDISWGLVERISLMKNDIAEISCSFQCPNLSTLLLGRNMLVNISGEFFQFMPALVVLGLSKNRSLIVLPEEVSNLVSLQYLDLALTGIRSLPVGLMKLRKLIYLNLEYTRALESIVGIPTSLPNLQVLKLLGSNVYVDDILMEELQQLEHLKILTANVKDALIFESIQGLNRLASCIHSLCLRNMSAEVITFNTVALVGLQRLVIKDSRILEIKIDWESKKKSELPCTSYPGFKQLSDVLISGLEGPKDLTWLMHAQDLKFLSVGHSSSIEEIINREKEMSIAGNLHSDIDVPLQKLKMLCITDMDGLKSICWNPQSLTNLERCIKVGKLSKLPQAAIEFGGSNVEVLEFEG